MSQAAFQPMPEPEDEAFNQSSQEPSMLTPQLARLRDALIAKGYSKRSAAEDKLLAELQEAEQALEEAAKNNPGVVVEGFQKKAYGSSPVMGPAPGSCPICGGSW